VPDEEYRRFKRLLFGDAVSDWIGVYETWWTANGEFPTLSVSERLRLAEDAVRELIDAGLVDLYQGTWVDRPGEPVARDEYGTVLRQWSTWVIPPNDPPEASPVVWMGADEPADAAAWKAILDSL
jgi:hypothetical protein